MIQLTTITKTKSPLSTVAWMLDWSGDLASGDIISASTWSSPDVTLTVVSSSFTNTTTTVMVGAGTGPLSSVINRITTANGLIFYQTIQIRIRGL